MIAPLMSVSFFNGDITRHLCFGNEKYSKVQLD